MEGGKKAESAYNETRVDRDSLRLMEFRYVILTLIRIPTATAESPISVGGGLACTRPDVLSGQHWAGLPVRHENATGGGYKCLIGGQRDLNSRPFREGGIQKHRRLYRMQTSFIIIRKEKA